MGALGIRVGTIEEVKPALTRILSSGKPGVLKISIEPHKTRAHLVNHDCGISYFHRVHSLW
jgi:thiamine pyrophosphate-dependent acetolactate synthase large subunit-like protein